VRREVRERIEAFMREKGFVSPSDTIAFLFELYDSRIRLEEKMRELEDRLSLVERYMEDLLFLRAPTPQAQAPQAQPQVAHPSQPQPSQPPEPKLIPASELPEAKKALGEAEAGPRPEEPKAEAKAELRPFVIKRNPVNPERYRKKLESLGMTVTGEVEEVTKKGPVKIVFGTTPEVVDKICGKLTELKISLGTIKDGIERAKLDGMFKEEPYVSLGTRAYLLNSASLIIREVDGTWRRA
jgi:hypothetical protein